MESDLAINGNVLYAVRSWLRSTNGGNVSQVLFNPNGGVTLLPNSNVEIRISSFMQITSERILIADAVNVCILQFHRTSSTLSEFAGKCREAGNRDGVGTNARFNTPFTIILNVIDPTEAMIADTGRLRAMSLDTGSVRTVARWERWRRPYAMCWYMSSLMLARDNGISRLFPQNETLTDVTGWKKGNTDGSIRKAQFGLLTGIAQLHSSGVFVAMDVEHNKLRLIDLTSDVVTSICTGVSLFKEASLEECGIYRPRSVLLNGQNLFVGHNGGIAIINGK